MSRNTKDGASFPVEGGLEGLRPLQTRAYQLQDQALHEQEGRLKRWEQSERPVLRDHALGMKQTLNVLGKEEAILRQRVSNLETNTVKNCPGTSTGFNVIRARVDNCGKPLETESLRRERDRLKASMHKIEAEIANAKAEIAANRRGEEVEIWETKLVAMQDTKRVYLEEINLIDVELLGREHFERMERDRQHAESTGLAQLKRLQEHMLQTRLKYNKAKHEYYFPKEKGFNITFGGGGIFGACKDICISEIHGNLKIVSEPGEYGASGPITPARITVTFQAANKPEKSNKRDFNKSPSRKAHTSRNMQRETTSSEERERTEEIFPVKPSPLPAQQKEKVRFDDTANGNNGADPVSVPPVQHLSGSSQMQPDVQQLHQQYASPEKPPPRGFARRFMRRIGSKKEKYQGKSGSRLDPLPEDENLDAQPKRSLARKLLSRRSGKSSKRSSSLDVDNLSFGGNRLDGTEGSIGTVDDDFSCMDVEVQAHSTTQSTLMPVAESSQSRNGGRPLEMSEGDGSLASDVDDEQHLPDSNTVDSPLTREMLEKAEKMILGDESQTKAQEKHHSMSGKSFSRPGLRTTSTSKGSWLLDSNGSESYGIFDDEVSSFLDVEDPDLNGEEISEGEKSIGGMQGVYCNGRLSGFELVGEKGSKVPNLTIGNADVSATVFVKLVFEYDKDQGWRPGQKAKDRPKFHVEKLKYSIQGNNVPMPPTLIKHILRVAIPGLIQRRLLALLPPELGEYVQTARRGFTFDADVGLVGPSVAVLDVDVSFAITGPTRSEREARKQQSQFEAAKEARNLLNLSLPQAQILSELFCGKLALMSPPRIASISNLISFRAKYDAHPEIFKQLCSVLNAAYHMLAQNFSKVDVSDFSFYEFMEGAVARVRKKPARARVIVKHMDISVNADAVVTAIHDFTKRSIEDLAIIGPLTDPHATVDSMRETIAEDLEVLHAWHVFALSELNHFKSKFKTAGGTVLLAADKNGISVGVENSHYEGPLRLRMPVSLPLDHDGAVSFELPLPSPAGNLGVFMDNFKSLTVPSHLRPPAQAINWVPIVDDSVVNERMSQQVANGIEMIRDVIQELQAIIERDNLCEDDKDGSKALTQPRTLVGDKLGRMIINRLKVKVRLDERRIGEIMSGLDSKSLGSNEAFVATAGRIISHLGDAMQFGFVPSAPNLPGVSGETPTPDKYLMHLESTDISRLRAEVQSLGFQSAITPGAFVRLFHAIIRAAQIAFMSRSPESLQEFRTKMEGWYSLLTREDLNISCCLDTAGEVVDGVFIASFRGTAEEDALRATSPLVLTNELDLVPLGKAMRGDYRQNANST